MYVMIRHVLLKEEALSTVKDVYESEVMGPVINSEGNRLFCVVNSVEREREVRQITGWDSKEDCDRYLSQVLPAVYEKWEWVFERKPETSFWEIKWPGKFHLDPDLLKGSETYIRTSRFKFKPEGVAVVKASYDEGVINPVFDHKGNKFIFVLLSTEEERRGSQVSGWESKEDCDRYLNEVYPGLVNGMRDVFEEMPTATFWELKWPGRVQF